MADEEQGFISVETAGKLLKLTPRQVQRLAADGWIKKIDGRYTVVAVVQGYIAYLKDETRRNSRQSAGTRSQEARAREVEQRIAIKDRRLADIDEVRAINDQTWGEARDLILGFPIAFTRDLDLRRQLEKAMDDICNRIADRIRQSQAAVGELETQTDQIVDRSDLPATGKDDSGSVGERE